MSSSPLRFDASMRLKTVSLNESRDQPCGTIGRGSYAAPHAALQPFKYETHAESEEKCGGLRDEENALRQGIAENQFAATKNLHDAVWLSRHFAAMGRAKDAAKTQVLAGVIGTMTDRSEALYGARASTVMEDPQATATNHTLLCL